MQAEIDELRRKVAELESPTDEVDEELSDAEVVSSARADVAAADAARARAAAALAELSEKPSPTRRKLTASRDSCDGSAQHGVSLRQVGD